MTKEELFSRLRGGLIVSCQALEQEPLHSSLIMGRMALAAKEGGAVGIRANTPEDIAEIKRVVDLPVIGLYKVEYPDSEVYITPTMAEVDALMEVSPDVIALDATFRPRPGGKSLDELVTEIRKRYPQVLLMADTSCYKEGKHAEELGFDLVGTTMSGYTAYTRGTPLPDFTLMQRYVKSLSTPVIAEGGIWTPEQLRQAVDLGVLAAVVGTAITRPQDITRRFTAALKG